MTSTTILPAPLVAALAAATLAGCGDDDEAFTADNPAPTGVAVEVQGLRYETVQSRQLNPALAPDQAFVPDRQLPQDTRWFGVFLRVCNDTDQPRTPTADLVVTGTAGQAATRVELPEDNPYALDREPLPPGQCAPEEGTTAARATDGHPLVYTVDDDVWNSIPLKLEVRAEDDSDTRAMVLDR